MLHWYIGSLVHHGTSQRLMPLWFAITTTRVTFWSFTMLKLYCFMQNMEVSEEMLLLLIF